VTIALVIASPWSFTALQMYSPESSEYMDSISKDTKPKSNIDLYLWPEGNGLPFLYHSTLNFGSFLGSTLVSKCTELASSTVVDSIYVLKFNIIISITPLY